MFMKKLVIFGILLILLVSGCVEERTPETTTTIQTTTTEIVSTTTLADTTTTLEEIENTTTTTISKRCRFLNFQIKSHSYRNDELTLYFNNIGSEVIDDFDVHLYFDNKTYNVSYINQSITYHVVRRYDLIPGPGLDNVTVVESACGKSYFVNV